MYAKHHHMTTMPNGGVGGDPLREARVRRSSQLSSTSSASSSTNTSTSGGGSTAVRRLSDTTREGVRNAARTVDKLTTIRISSSGSGGGGSSPSSPKPPSPHKAKDDREHRSRLLNRLGIYGRITHGREHTNNTPCNGGTSASSQRRPSDCSTASLLSCASSLAATADSSSSPIRRTSNGNGDDDAIITAPVPTSAPASAPTCSYRIADVPRDPATIRKMNMLRSLGVGGIRSSADHLPRTAVPVGFDNSWAAVARGASRPKIADLPFLVEPLKYVREAEEVKKEEEEEHRQTEGKRRTSDPPAPPDLKKMLDQLSLSSTCSTSASSLPSECGDKTPPRSTKNNNNHGKKKRKSIRFAPSVSVVQIPMRSEYSSRIATRLWSSRTEIRDNAHRNVVEFSAEDWDWRKVVEDDGMFVCTASGELVHPVHCQDFVPANNYSQQQQHPHQHQHQPIDASDSTEDILGFTLD